MRTILLTMLLALTAGAAAAQDVVPWSGPAQMKSGDTAYFDQRHDESYA